MIQIDMEMPTNCYDCWIRQNMGCRIANDSGWLNDRRDDNCPLKAQEPAEDWISRKRLRDEIQYYIEEAGWGDDVNKVLGWCLEFIDNQEAVKWE